MSILDELGERLGGHVVEEEVQLHRRHGARPVGQAPVHVTAEPSPVSSASSPASSSSSSSSCSPMSILDELGE
jgi:hypothetical protein